MKKRRVLVICQDTALPPPDTTPTRANCDPPVNISSDSAHVWSTDSPAAVASAPYDRA